MECRGGKMFALSSSLRETSLVAQSVKNPPRFDPWVGKISQRRKWQSTPVPLPGKSYEQRSLVGYSPWGCKESDTTERLHFHPDFTPISLVSYLTFICVTYDYKLVRHNVVDHIKELYCHAILLISAYLRCGAVVAALADGLMATATLVYWYCRWHSLSPIPLYTKHRVQHIISLDLIF